MAPWPELVQLLNRCFAAPWPPAGAEAFGWSVIGLCLPRGLRSLVPTASTRACAKGFESGNCVVQAAAQRNSVRALLCRFQPASDPVAARWSFWASPPELGT